MDQQPLNAEEKKQDTAAPFSRRGLIAGTFAFFAALGVWLAGRSKFFALFTTSALPPSIAPAQGSKNLTEARLDVGEMLKHISMLAQGDWQGRRAGSLGESRAAEYIASHWEQWGLKPAGIGNSFFQTYELPGLAAYWQGSRLRLAHTHSDQSKADNVLAFLPGQNPALKDQVVILSAHYDHLGIHQGELFPGANDNASGVAVMMEVSRLLAQRPELLGRSVLFAAWSGEEAGLLGSRKYIQQPSVSLDRVVGVVNLDTLANGETNRFIYWAPLQLPWQTTLERVSTHLKLELQPVEPGGHSSDHKPFADAGIPAMTILSASWLEGNHTPNDNGESINKEKLFRASLLAWQLIKELSEGSGGKETG